MSQKFDVVVYEMRSRKVESVIGKNMPRSKGSFHTAEKRLDTAFSRINLERYSACIVEAGKYSVGDVLP